MKLKSKIGFAIVLLIALLAIGTCVKAAEFTSRILSTKASTSKYTYDERKCYDNF